jgi:hypothetical protein
LTQVAPPATLAFHDVTIETEGKVLMNTASFAQSQLESAFELFNMCAGNMNDEQYNWKPAGTSNIAAKSHVHGLTSVDFFINGIVRGEKLKWGDVASSNGLPENPMAIWTHEQPIPYSALTAYGKDVQKDVLAYVGTLSDADFDREIETNFFGKKSVAWLVQLACNHLVGHGGEIAAVKGMQGLKGLPF